MSIPDTLQKDRYAELVAEKERLTKRVRELETIIDDAIETIHAMANEQVHREHGCPYDIVDSADLFEIEDEMKGKLNGNIPI